VAVAAIGLAAGLVGLEYGEPHYSVPRLMLVAAVGLIMVGAGLAARASGESRVGALVVLGGYSWLLERLLGAVHNQLVISIGGLLPGLWTALLIHAVTAFPGGRLTNRLDRLLVVAYYVLQVGGQVGILLTLPTFEPRGGVGPNKIVIFHSAALAEGIGHYTDLLTIPLLLVLVGVFIHRAMVAAPPVRRAYGFVWTGAIVLCANLALLITAGLGYVNFNEVYGLWLEYLAGVVPLTMVVSLFVARLAQDRLVTLVVDLDSGEHGERLLASLRHALTDPSLELVYASAEGWIDAEGRPVQIDADRVDRRLTLVTYRGASIGALVHDPVLLRNPGRLATATAAAGLAIDNERLQAELRARLSDVEASRARIVEAGDKERRRVERNLHDGAQQRLVGLALTLSLAARQAGPGAQELLAEAAQQLDEAIDDLRVLAQGIHPAILTAAGLAGALEVLAQRPGTPVELQVDVPDRLPEAVEAGAYFVLAEGLANTNKHARASVVTVQVNVVGQVLHLHLRDDGRGGADPSQGSGLEGLADRVSALRGQLTITSPPGAGTTLIVELPMAERESVAPAGVTAEANHERDAPARLHHWPQVET
jgi:signal transduction histidine kinase